MEQWTIRDQLCLASCVMRLGEDNWSNVSKHLKQLVEVERSGFEMFSLKNCASEYGRLIDAISAPKRRRIDGGGAQPPAAQLVSRLTLARIEELKKTCQLQKLEYQKLQKQIHEDETRKSRSKEDRENSDMSKAGAMVCPFNAESPSHKDSNALKMDNASIQVQEKALGMACVSPPDSDSAALNHSLSESSTTKAGINVTSSLDITQQVKTEGGCKEVTVDLETGSGGGTDRPEDVDEEEEEVDDLIGVDSEDDHDAKSPVVISKNERLSASVSSKSKISDVRKRRSRVAVADHSNSGKQSLSVGESPVGITRGLDRKRRRSPHDVVDDLHLSSDLYVPPDENPIIQGDPSSVLIGKDDTSTSSTTYDSTTLEEEMDAESVTPGEPTPIASASPSVVVRFELNGGDDDEDDDDEGSNDVFEGIRPKSSSNDLDAAPSELSNESGVVDVPLVADSVGITAIHSPSVCESGPSVTKTTSSQELSVFSSAAGCRSSDKTTVVDSSPTTPDQEYREPIILKIKKPQPKTPPKSKRSGSSKDGSPSSRRSTTPKSPRLRATEVLLRRRSPSPEDEIEFGPPGSTPIGGNILQNLIPAVAIPNDALPVIVTAIVEVPDKDEQNSSEDLLKSTSSDNTIPLCVESGSAVVECVETPISVGSLEVVDQKLDSSLSQPPPELEYSDIPTDESPSEADETVLKSEKPIVPVALVSNNKSADESNQVSSPTSLKIKLPKILDSKESEIQCTKVEESSAGETKEVKQDEEQEASLSSTPTRSGSTKTRRSAAQEKLQNARTKPSAAVPSRRSRGRGDGKLTDPVGSPLICPTNFTSMEDYKLWKKTMMLIWKAAAGHRHANVFLHPVTDEIAPDYNKIVFRPMDLSTIKKNLENSVIVTTEEFQKAILLMFANAVMYNNADHEVHQMATEMFADVVRHMKELLPASDHLFSSAVAAAISPSLEASVVRSGKSLRSRSATRASSSGTPNLAMSSPLPSRAAPSVSGSAGDVTSSDLDISCNRSLCGSDNEDAPLSRRLRNT